jgi:hypothetical protein
MFPNCNVSKMLGTLMAEALLWKGTETGFPFGAVVRYSVRIAKASFRGR